MRSLFHLANYAPERKNSLGRLCSYPHETARSQCFLTYTKEEIHIFEDDHVIIRTKLEKPSKIKGLALI